MKNISLLIMSLFLLITADVRAELCCADTTNLYARVLGGANFLQNTTINGNKTNYETGYVVTGAVGYDWCRWLSVEAEYAYRRNGINKIDFYVEGFSNCGYYHSSSITANLLWDLPFCSWRRRCGFVHPFVGAGAGYNFQKMHASNSRFVFNQKWNQFSWQLLCGIAYPIVYDIEMILQYTFHQGGCHFNNHSLEIGLKDKLY